MFKTATSFNQDIGHWDTTNVTAMANTFYDAESFNQDIGAWDTSRVTTVRSMFQTALVFNQDIGKWNTSNVTDMSGQFNNALAFNQDIGKWDTSNVTNMELMVEFTLAFNQNLGSWNIASVQFLDGMFAEYTGLSTALLIGFAGQPVHRNQPHRGKVAPDTAWTTSSNIRRLALRIGEALTRPERRTPLRRLPAWTKMGRPCRMKKRWERT